ncbi:hypothetical protein NP233_g8529 [Leucocoprinus birnbaumii]|uniref:Uncharacterized protein n=1 Tax=Leucocoprinus birnbaumii TaxID=56174 RepID=A0AAD5YNZ7_9AGAR|nr:hypothetical protein NP233_g8529 [Leucocoprinus birnbaumii]
MQLRSLFYFSSLATVALGATIQDVVGNIGDIQTQATTLNNAITGFPIIPSITNLGTIVSIISTTGNAIITLETATTNAQSVPTPVSVADATLVLNAINSCKGPVEAALAALVKKKSAFQALLNLIPGTSSFNPIRQGLIILNFNVMALGNLLVSMAPTELQAQAVGNRTEIFNAFTTTIAAF